MKYINNKLIIAALVATTSLTAAHASYVEGVFISDASCEGDTISQARHRRATARPFDLKMTSVIVADLQGSRTFKIRFNDVPEVRFLEEDHKAENRALRLKSVKAKHEFETTEKAVKAEAEEIKEAEVKYPHMNFSVFASAKRNHRK